MQGIVHHARIEDVVNGDGLSLKHRIGIEQGVEALIDCHLGELFLGCAELVHMAPLYERIARVGARCWPKRRLELGTLAGRRQTTRNAWSEASHCRIPAAPEDTPD